MRCANLQQQNLIERSPVRQCTGDTDIHAQVRRQQLLSFINEDPAIAFEPLHGLYGLRYLQFIAPQLLRQPKSDYQRLSYPLTLGGRMR